MGTPAFAVRALEALLPHHAVIACVTQPDRRSGRGGAVSFSEVKTAAQTADIPVLQPEKIKTAAFYDALAAYKADIFVVAAYGRILPERILNMPAYGAVNIHASLLPVYRGAAPIQRALINGDNKTGITIMQMDKGIDTGDILLQEELPIKDSDTYGSLHDALSELGARLILDALAKLEAGTVRRERQNETAASYAPMLVRTDERIDWHKTAREIFNLARGLNPRPGAYTTYKGEPVKIFSCAETDAYPGEPGAIHITDGGITVCTGSGGVRIYELQKAGGKKMDAAAFLRGSGMTEEDFFM